MKIGIVGYNSINNTVSVNRLNLTENPLSFCGKPPVSTGKTFKQVDKILSKIRARLNLAVSPKRKGRWLYWLQKLGAPSGIVDAIQFFGDKSRKVRYQAVRTVIHLINKPQITSDVKRVSRRELSSGLKDQYLAKMRKLLRDSNPRIRDSAMRIIAGIGEEADIKLLQHMQRDKVLSERASFYLAQLMNKFHPEALADKRQASRLNEIGRARVDQGQVMSKGKGNKRIHK